MKSIIYETVDGIEIIKHLDTLLPDPEATRTAAKAIIDQLPEAVELKAKVSEGTKNETKIRTYRDNFLVVYKNIGQQIINQNPKITPTRELTLAAMEADTRKKFDDDEKMYAAFTAQKDIIQSELAEITVRLKQKSKDVRRQNPVFRELKKNEIVKTGEEFQAFADAIKNKSKTEQIKTDGTTVIDLRGKKYNTKTNGTWSEGEITTLGIEQPVGVVLTDDLTEVQKTEISDQKEAERLTGLTAEQKLVELDQKKQVAMSQSIAMRAELDILADPEALTKAQAWYADEITRLELVYV